MLNQTTLTDTFARQFYYLRLSITDMCNFRCTYCLPEGYQSRQPQTFLNQQEIALLARAFCELGTEKIRLTGGEPTLRKDLTEIITVIKQNTTLQHLVMTTNGSHLVTHIQQWHAAGLTGVNVSVDSLDTYQFYRITGKDRLNYVMAGIDAALALNSLQVKVNSVLLHSFYKEGKIFKRFLHWIKTRPIQLRFIELMATGDGQALFKQQHFTPQTLLEELINTGWRLKSRQRSDGPAHVFQHPDYLGEIGFILPYQPNFCHSCNRLRVSSRGDLHLCLFGNEGISLRDYLQSPEQLILLKQLIQKSLNSKQAGHFLHQGNSGQTNNLSQIGG